MSKSKQQETFDQLVAEMAPNETWQELARRAKVSSRSFRLWRSGKGGKRPFRPTVTKVATALGVSFERAEAAIKASAG